MQFKSVAARLWFKKKRHLLASSYIMVRREERSHRRRKLSFGWPLSFKRGSEADWECRLIAGDELWKWKAMVIRQTTVQDEGLPRQKKRSLVFSSCDDSQHVATVSIITIVWLRVQSLIRFLHRKQQLRASSNRYLRGGPRILLISYSELDSVIGLHSFWRGQPIDKPVFCSSYKCRLNLPTP